MRSLYFVSFMDMQGGLLEPIGTKEGAVGTNQGRVEEVYDRVVMSRMIKSLLSLYN